MDEEELDRAKAAVKDLYAFSAHFFQNHGVEHASKKWDKVRVQMEETLGQLDSVRGSLPKMQYWSLRGRALNILPEHSQEAEDCLSRAIKHDPSLMDTWNALGESYWKSGKLQQAHDCFIGSLAHSKNKESLRNLSMVLRQLGKDQGEKEAKAMESLEWAKEAVSLDVKDGTSWMILGNAFLALFFMSGQDIRHLKQCNSAYTNAEKDPVAATNPDLHYNRATLCHYEEDYQTMVTELELASSLDPAWAQPKDKLRSTWDFLTTMAHLISSKGRVKAKALAVMMESLSTPDSYLSGDCGAGGGVGASERVLALLSELNEGANDDVTVVVGVVAVVPSEYSIPYGCVVVDKVSSSHGLTLYNLASDAHIAVGKILTLPKPFLHRCTVHYNGQEVKFSNLRVTDPSKLMVDGQIIAADKLAPSTLIVTAFT